MSGIFQGFMSFIQTALTSIYESFNRPDTSSLTTADGTAAQWKSVRGSWGITSNQASTSTSPSNYPMSTLLFTNTDVTIGLDNIGPGAGTAFWVTDSGNWWGAYLDGVQTCQTCGGNFYSGYACYVPGNYVPGNPNPGTYTPGNTNPGTYTKGNCNTSYGLICYGTNPGTYTPGGTNPGTYTPGGINAGYTNPGHAGCYYSGYNATYPCNCVTNTNINIIQSIANVISSIVNFTFSSTVVGFKTILSGNNLTVRGYSSTGYSNQIGSDQTTTLSGYTKTNQHGILLAPITYTPAQTSVIDEFDVY